MSLLKKKTNILEPKTPVPTKPSTPPNKKSAKESKPLQTPPQTTPPPTKRGKKSKDPDPQKIDDFVATYNSMSEQEKRVALTMIKGSSSERTQAEYSTPVKKPKPLHNAFAHFCKANKQKKTGDGTEETGDLKDKWNALSADEKAPYLETEAEERKAHVAAHGPIKPAPPYMMFCNRLREELACEKLSTPEFAKRAGEKWKQLTAEEKKPFEDVATKAKEEYLKEKETWQQEHPDYVKPKRGEPNKSKRKLENSDQPKPKKAATAYALFIKDPEQRKLAAEQFPEEFKKGSLKAKSVSDKAEFEARARSQAPPAATTSTSKAEEAEKEEEEEAEKGGEDEGEEQAE